MDAKDLYRQGVTAIRDHKDLETGRRLLAQSLKLEPNNDMGWLWLSRTITDPNQQRQYVERALSINPDNARAREIYQRLQAKPRNNGGNLAAIALAAGVSSTQTMKAVSPGTPQTPQQRQIAALLKKADALLEKGNDEGAIEQWVHVLEIQVDHEIAMRHAVKHLVRLKYYDDAKELAWRAIHGGTTHPSIYLTAMDFARRDGEHDKLEMLREQLVRLPNADEGLIVKVVEDYLKSGQNEKARAILKDALENYPQSQKLLLHMGDVSQKLGRPSEATLYFERAAKTGLRTREGKEADKRLSQYAPVLTDRERGSLALAWREAAGFGVCYLLLAWQDAGLDLLRLGPARWAGVLLSLAGGYLLVTATSSPQQTPLARMLGGAVPRSGGEPLVIKKQSSGALEDPTQLPIIPEALRYALGGLGAVMLLLAFWLVFSTAIELLFNPVPPDWQSLLILEEDF